MSNKLKIILAIITSILVLSGSAIIFNSQRRNNSISKTELSSSSSSSTVSSISSSQVSSISISSNSVVLSSVLGSSLSSEVIRINPESKSTISVVQKTCNLQPKNGIQIVYSGNNCFWLIVNERYNGFTADDISLIQSLKNQYQTIATDYFVNSNLASDSKISIDLTRYISPNTVQVDVSTIDLNYNNRTEALTKNQKTYTLTNQDNNTWKLTDNSKVNNPISKNTTNKCIADSFSEVVYYKDKCFEYNSNSMYPFGDTLLLTDVASRLPQDARPLVKKFALSYYDSIENSLNDSPVIVMVLAPKYQNSKISIGFGYSQKTDSSNEGLKNYNSITYYTIYQDNNIWKSGDNSVVQPTKPICQVQKEGNIEIILTDNGCFGLSKSLRTIVSEFKFVGSYDQINNVIVPMSKDYYSRIRPSLITKSPIISTNFITHISNTKA